MVNTRIDTADWISLSCFIDNNGGLIRIPFLNFTGAVVNIIKHIGQQVSNIIQTIHSLGYICTSLSTKDIHLNRHNGKVMFSHLPGVARLDSDESVCTVPDHHLLSEHLSSDLVAPEMVDSNILTIDHKLDTFLFG